MTFPAEVEQWRKWIDMLKFTYMPTNALLAWIGEESGGNPGSTGLFGHDAQGVFNQEAGIGQQYFETRTSTVGGWTIDDLRAACGPDPHNQHILRPLTDEENEAQASALIYDADQSVKTAARQLQDVGVSWTEPEVWCLAKLQHGLPAIAGMMLKPAPDHSSWGVWWRWLNSLKYTDVHRIAAPCSPFMPLDRFRVNAEVVGGTVGVIS